MKVSTTCSLDLILVGYACTKNHIVFHENLSPSEFYARADTKTFRNQIDLLQFKWPNLTEKQFIKNVRSASVKKNVWIHDLYLKPIHTIHFKISGVSLNDLNTILARGMYNPITNFEEFDRIILQYPTIRMDFLPLLRLKCGSNKVDGQLKPYLIYYLQSKPHLLKTA